MVSERVKEFETGERTVQLCDQVCEVESSRGKTRGLEKCVLPVEDSHKYLIMEK